MQRAVVWLIAIAGAIAGAGCGGSRCHEVKSARDMLAARRGAPNRRPDLRLIVPFARANDTIADLLKQEPITMPLDPPDLGPIEIPALMTAVVRGVTVMPGAEGKARFALVIDLADGDGNAGVVAMDAVVEVEPRLVRGPGGAELAIGFGPQNLVSVKPALASDAKDKLRGAVNRWLPSRLKDKLPAIATDVAVRKLATHLTGVAWETLRRTLLKKLGDLTQLRFRLPDVPIASTHLRSTPRAMVVDMTTDLPVRRGLSPSADDDTEVNLRMSGSTVAELANWAVDHGHAPRWYDRNIKPKPSGEFRPRFDYVAEDRAHPFKVYSFQERGGCSYFRVGVRANVAVEGDSVKGTVTDQQLEKRVANPLVETLAWAKYFLIGGLDRSRKVAAHTQLAIGTRTLTTRITRAAIVDDELRFTLALDAR